MKKNLNFSFKPYFRIWCFLLFISVTHAIAIPYCEFLPTIIKLGNDNVEFTFSRNHGTLIGVQNKVTDYQYLSGTTFGNFLVFIDSDATTQWNTELGTPYSARNEILDSVATNWIDGSLQLELVHDSIAGYDIQTCSLITISPIDSVAEWRIVVSNKMSTGVAGVILYPQVLGLVNNLPDDYVIWPADRGQKYDYVGTDLLFAAYPGFACMQWFYYGNDDEGLYYSVQDDTVQFKEFRFGRDDGLNDVSRGFSVANWPFVTPGQSWASYPIEFGVLSNGWYTAADRYRDWLINQAQWQAPAAPWVKEFHGFNVSVIKTCGNPALPYSEIPSRAAGGHGFDIHTVDVIGWHYSGFDCSYPDYYFLQENGGAASFASAVNSAHVNDDRVLTYINGQLVNMTSIWLDTVGNVADTRDVYGNRSYQYWIGGTFVVQNAGCSGWIDKLGTHIQELIGAGVDGIWYDQIGCDPAQRDHTAGRWQKTPAESSGGGYMRMLDTHRQFWTNIYRDPIFLMEGCQDAYGKYVNIHGLVWGNHFNKWPFDYPEVAAYSLPGKLLGLQNDWGISGQAERYWTAFSLGMPLIDGNAAACPRFFNIYDSLPDCFFYGRPLADKGINSSSMHALLGINKRRIALPLINKEFITVTKSYKLDLEKLGIGTVDRMYDAETGSDIAFSISSQTIAVTQTLAAKQIKCLVAVDESKPCLASYPEDVTLYACRTQRWIAVIPCDTGSLHWTTGISDSWINLDKQNGSLFDKSSWISISTEGAYASISSTGTVWFINADNGVTCSYVRVIAEFFIPEPGISVQASVLFVMCLFFKYRIRHCF